MIITAEGSGEHAAPGHPERPERLEAILERIDGDGELSRIARTVAAPADESAVLAVHTPAHLRALEGLSLGGGGWIDTDTYCAPGSHRAALGAAGAATASVDAVMAGAAFAFAPVRPPGHHAEPERAMGFCLLDNAAIAVRHAQRAHGVGRVAVIDIDVHHGNGVESAVEGDSSVLYTSLHQHPLYPGTGARSARRDDPAVTLNLPLPAGTDGEAWLSVFRSEVVPALDRFEPELVVVSAGYDAHAADPLAGLKLEAATYGKAATEIAALGRRHGGRGTVWLLEGGYDLEALASSVEATLRALVGG